MFDKQDFGTLNESCRSASAESVNSLPANDFTEVSAMLHFEEDEQTVLFLAGDTEHPVFLDVFASAEIEVFPLTLQKSDFPKQPEMPSRSSAQEERFSQAGWALIDLAIAVLIIGVLVAFGLSALYYQTTGNELDELQQSSRETADDALSQLVVQIDRLPDDSTFTLDNNSPVNPVITITKPCSIALCDYVQVQSSPASSNSNGNTNENTTKKRGGSPAGGFYPTFAGATFLRRWSIQTVDPELDLKEITVVILRNETDTAPLAVFKHKTPLTLNR